MKGSARPRNEGRGRIALLLFACALLLRFFVPAGWMPEANASGVTLRWCSEGSGSAEAQARAEAMLAAAMDHGPPHEQTPAPDEPCAFAAGCQPLVPTQAPSLLLPSTPPVAAPVAQLLPIPGRGLVAPPPFATGPPHLA
jgi:hypothetical protein